MTAQQHPDPVVPEPAADERDRRLGKLIGTVLSATVLVIGNVATLFFTVVAWLMWPTGIGDSNHIEGALFTALAGMVLGLVTALLAIVPVKARWLSKRWFIVPVALFIVATVRWVYIDAAYPEPTDRYGSGQVTVESAPLVERHSEPNGGSECPAGCHSEPNRSREQHAVVSTMRPSESATEGR